MKSSESDSCFNPYKEDFISNRYNYYSQYRSKDPVHLGTSTSSLVPRTWYLFEYDDVSTYLKDNRMVRNYAGHHLPIIPDQMKPFADMTSKWMLFKDPPEHTRMRSMVNKYFTFDAIENLTTKIEEIASFLLDSVKNKMEMDLISEYAYPLPLLLIAHLLGVPIRDRKLFRVWSIALAAGIDLHQSPTVIIKASEATREIKIYI